MFRRQQTHQNKPSTGIKSFSSRVERRKRAIVEEKREEEESENVVEDIPKKKTEDLPNFKEATVITGNQIDKIEVSGNGATTVTFKSLVGDYSLNKSSDGNLIIYTIDLLENSELWNKISGISGTPGANLNFPSYQPATIEGVEILKDFKKIYSGSTEQGGSDNAHLRFYNNSDTSQKKDFIINNSDTTSSVKITDLYLVNPAESKMASDVFTLESVSQGSEVKKFTKISGYTATEYTSNNKNHADIVNLHSTNYIIKKTGEKGILTNNLIVTSTIPPEVYDSLSLPFKLDTNLNVLPYNSNNNVYAINSINAIPIPGGNGANRDCIIDLSEVTLGEPSGEKIDISGKFNDFYVNYVTIKPDNTNQLITRFTQASGNKYLGSKVTILKADGGDGLNAPVDDPLVPLIKDLTYSSNGSANLPEIQFTIKPNDKEGLLIGNRENAGTAKEVKSHIIIDLSSSPLSDKLASWVPDSQKKTRLIFNQEAVILHGNWDKTNGPIIGLNGYNFNAVAAIKKVTIKYLKKGDESAGTQNEIKTVILNSAWNLSSGEFGMDQIINNIDMLYLVNGTVSSENRLLTPISNPFNSVTENGTTTYSINGIPELVSDSSAYDGQIQIRTITTTDNSTNYATIKDFYVTNLIPKFDPTGITPKKIINLVVKGNLPDWTINSTLWNDGENGYTIKQDANTKDKWIIASDGSKNVNSINFLPVDGYGSDLDIGVDFSNTNSAILGTSDSPIELPVNNDENKLELFNFNMNTIYVKKTKDKAQLDLTGTIEHSYEGTTVIVSGGSSSGGSSGDDSGNDTGYIKIETLDDLYNLMMEPRIVKDNTGVLFATSTNTKDITSLVMETDYYLFYSPTLVKNTPRLVIEKVVKPTGAADTWKPNKDGYKLVQIMREEIIDDKGTDDVDDNSSIFRIFLQYKDDKDVEHIIPYGVVGNGAFPGSQLDPKYEVDGNKWNLKIESIMKGINIRQVIQNPLNDKLDLNVASITEEKGKIKKSEMYEYICEIKRTISAMPFNSRYLNEILGYLSKCLAFEQVRLPSIRESDNQGLESVNEEYDSENNPNGWIEKYTTEFERNGINYKVVDGYENYKFREGGKHDELINEMKSKLAQIYMFGELSDSNNLDLDDIMNKLVNNYIETWMKYYKGLVVPNDLIMSEYSDIEIYEDESIYKVFEGNSEEGTHIISQLTDGNINDEEGGEDLRVFIEEIMKYFKDEINDITGIKKDIKGITIEDMVAYEDPMRENISVNADQNGINSAYSNDENNLIEYSQMLSTIQGERNKLQRQGNKNKVILKFTQTVKGTFFELLGKEKMNIDQKSQIFGFFLSELKEIVNHTKRENRVIDRKSRRGVKTIQAIPEEIEGKRYLRITKIPEFYEGDPLDWINDNYYSNKIFVQNCDNLYIGIDPELDQRIEVTGTPTTIGSEEFREQEMIGYYILKIQY